MKNYQAVEILKDLVRIPSVSYEELEAAKYLQDFLATHGFNVKIDEWNNVIAERKGSGGSSRLMILGHHDTVEAGDLNKWTHDPFGAEEEEGIIYGRGASDEKGGLACAMAAIDRLLKEHTEGLKGDILFVSSREEILDLSERGILKVLANNDIQADGCLCVEPTKMCNIALGQKGRSVVDITTHGKNAHGSTPDLGINAIMHMGHLLVEIDRMQLPNRPPLGPGTQCVGVVKGGIRANMVADQCDISIDRRIVMGENEDSVRREYEQVIAELQKRIPELKAEVSLRPTLNPACTDPESDIVRYAKEACAALEYPVETVYMNQHADIEWTINDAHIPSIIWGPGNADSCHAPDENISIEELVMGEKLYYEFMKRMLL